MEQLGADFELIAPDLRGCGDTGKPSPDPDATATADRQAQDMFGLMDAPLTCLPLSGPRKLENSSFDAAWRTIDDDEAVEVFGGAGGLHPASGEEGTTIGVNCYRFFGPLD